MLLEIEYPFTPKSRAPISRLAEAFVADHSRYAAINSMFIGYKDRFEAIKAEDPDKRQPEWNNPWIPALDGVALYAFVAQRNPSIYLEVGSGQSTKFVRRAISDNKLRTKIVSIDPEPRSEVDALCDEVVRAKLEDADLTVFDRLQADDVVFFDGSHRAFQNSDVTVFFTEIVPALKKGVLFGVHDIYLPWDYPEQWHGRYYSEQYLLTAYLLGGTALRVEYPAFYAYITQVLFTQLNPIWELEPLSRAQTHGGALWASVA